MLGMPAGRTEHDEHVAQRLLELGEDVPGSNDQAVDVQSRLPGEPHDPPTAGHHRMVEPRGLRQAGWIDVVVTGHDCTAPPSTLIP